MANYLVDHLDFIFLVYGLSFLFLALTAFSMSRLRHDGMPWAWLGWFALLHGLNEWADLVILVHGKILGLPLIGAVLLIASYVCLFEFGRRAVTWSGGRALTHWIYVALLGVLLYGAEAGLHGVTSLGRYVIGFPGAMLSAWAFWQWSVPGMGRRRPVRCLVLVGAMALYAVAGGLVVAKGPFWATSWLNTASFLDITGIPIQLVRAGVAGLLTLALWREHVAWRRARFFSRDMRRVIVAENIAALGVVVLLVSGAWWAQRYDIQCRRERSERLVELGRMIALSLDPAVVRGIVANPGGVSSEAVRPLREVVQAGCNTARDVRYLYLMGAWGGQVRFILDTEPEALRGAGRRATAVFGESYRDVPWELFQAFRSGKPRVSRPYTDEWGTFISAFCPVCEPDTGAVVAVLGIDEEKAVLDGMVLRARMSPLLLLGLVVIFSAMLVVFWRHAVEEAALSVLEANRLHRQQSALLTLSDLARAPHGDHAPDYREILREAGMALRVDRAEIWTSLPGGGYRVEGSYSIPHKLYETGETVGPQVIQEARDRLTRNQPWAVDHCGEEGGTPALAAVFRSRGYDAVLVAPVRVSGDLVGILVFAHGGGVRHWLNDEKRFAGEVAGQLSYMLVNAQRDQAEQALRKANEELESKVRERTRELSEKNSEIYKEMNERLRTEEEKRTLEVQIQQAQKYESLGLMAGGIAHDFNNVLMAIRGNIELARLELPGDSKIQEFLSDIDLAAARAANLSRQMLAFAGRGHLTVQGVDLNSQVQDMLQMMSASVGKKVGIQLELSSPLPPVDGDASQLGQVVMNLAINAAEAIGDKTGVITIRTGSLQLGSASPGATSWLAESLSPGPYVYLEVADTGCGMDEVTRRRIFDPFYTTKFTGRGMGLATVMGIVKGHRGAIEVTSQVGVGTTFRLLFPEGHRAAVRKPAHAPAPSPGRMGKGVILLVDDEESIRQLGKRMLQRLGFSVLVAGDGVEALDVHGEKRAEIRCVILDMTMPRMNGKETFAELRQRDPDLPVIICSGFHEEDIVAQLGRDKFSGFLQKPFDMTNLSASLKVALGQ